MAYNKFIVNDKLKTTYDHLEYMDEIAKKAKDKKRKKEELEDRKIEKLERIAKIGIGVSVTALFGIGLVIHGEYIKWVEYKHRCKGELPRYDHATHSQYWSNSVLTTDETSFKVFLDEEYGIELGGPKI